MDFEKFFNPRSIAVIGASNSVGKVGHALIYNILQNKDKKVFAINPKESEILGAPCYSCVLDVPESVDLAVIAVRADIVPQVLRECGEKQIPFAVVISAGFKEVGGRGVELEQEIAQIAEEYNIGLLGPNCLGVIDARSGLNATFGVDSPAVGNIALLSQSGALGTAMLDWASEQGIGFSKFVSLGNEATLTELDFLEFLKQDNDSKAVLLYLEKISDGEKFIRLVREITATKPIVILKAGRSDRGGEAVKSHTGSLTSEDSVFEAVCGQSGAIVVHSLHELFNVAKLFHIGILKSLKNLAVLTNGGGPSIVTADLIEFSQSLTLAEFSQELKDKLKSVLPEMGSVGNPIDILGDAPALRYKDALEILANENDIEAILTILTPQMMTQAQETAEILASYHKKKPIISIMIGGGAVQKGINVLKKNGLVNFDFPEDVVVALDTLTLDKKEQKAAPKEQPATNERQPDMGMMNFNETKALLQSYGLDLVGSFIKNKEELDAQYEQFDGQKMAIKVISSDVVHKTDVGAIKTNIDGKEALFGAWDELTASVLEHTPEARIEGMLVQPMVEGKEVIIGMKRDPVFGPVVVFGLGGIFVEVFKDVSMKVPPIDETMAREMIEDIKGFSILNGLRGEQPVNFDALVYIIMSVARLSTEHLEIQELDLNPVIINAEGAFIVDVRVMK